MSRLVLVCPEPLGHRQPAGIGIRFIEMAKVLAADGHAVTILSPDGGAVARTTALAMTPEVIARTTGENDVAIVQGHAANALFAHGKPLPTVVDLYDPFIVENLHYFAERGAEVFNHDHATLMRSLARGDFFLCASSAQRLFYLGLLLAAGRLSPVAFASDPHLDALIGVAPFGVQPPRAHPPKRGHDLLFGGIYDWYDPILAIDAVALVRNTIRDVTLTFTTHPNPELTPQGKAAEAIAHVKKRGYGDFVRFEPWVEYEKRGEFFDRFALALLTFRQSIETDLSMRTRVFDYLWGGLPVVTSSAPGTDEILNEYEAGIIVGEDSPDAFANAIREAFERRTMVDGAQRFAVTHQWPRTLEPLRQFCRRPHFDKNKDAFAVQLELPERPPSILDRLKRRIGGAF
ncbi:MAG TPA: glycosyltransferase family 4 protein [Thermoanaerobaculia bacterium]|nr:glycosyltransferase family 4 protein [Thermoanaerobaculia bacterium]